MDTALVAGLPRRTRRPLPGRKTRAPGMIASGKESLNTQEKKTNACDPEEFIFPGVCPFVLELSFPGPIINTLLKELCFPVLGDQSI